MSLSFLQGGAYQESHQLVFPCPGSICCFRWVPQLSLSRCCCISSGHGAGLCFKWTCVKKLRLFYVTPGCLCFFPLVLCFKVHSCTSRRWKYIQDEWCLQDKNTSISHPEFTVTTYCWYIFNKQKSNFSLFQLKVSQNVKAVLSLEQELMADSQPVCWMGVWWDSFCKLL